jgi:hypothetical protein
MASAASFCGHGKRVAVKVMQLPANALLGQAAPRANSAPHMAIMETVVSSTISHPNLVQVGVYDCFFCSAQPCL